MKKATAIAGSNIAFVKYWGNVDAQLRLPSNGSISMTLDRAQTVTTIEFLSESGCDTVSIDGRVAGETATARVSRHLDRIRQLAGVQLPARVVSRNSFPASAGIASSASGFAALTVAACAALGLSLSRRDLSRLARLGSGSACRSIFGGFVEWVPGARHEDSYAHQIAPANSWDLVDIIAVVSSEPKRVPSQMGHRLAPTSPFFSARLATVHVALSNVRTAILHRNLASLGEVAEADALSLHAVAMTARPSILYWQPGTVALLRSIREWREEGIEAYFTIDAGPNVHILTSREWGDAVRDRLAAIPEVKQTIECGPGGEARLSEAHLF